MSVDFDSRRFLILAAAQGALGAPRRGDIPLFAILFSSVVRPKAKPRRATAFQRQFVGYFTKMGTSLGSAATVESPIFNTALHITFDDTLHTFVHMTTGVPQASTRTI